MEDLTHLSGLSVSGCAWYAWKFHFDHWFEVLQVELEAVKFPVVCDCASSLQPEEYQDSPFRDLRVQNRQYLVHSIRHLFRDRFP